MFSTNPLAARSQGRALEVWRSAEELVGTRWKAFVDAEPDTRAGAFAAYVSALDAESAAAANLAGASLARIA